MCADALSMRVHVRHWNSTHPPPPSFAYQGHVCVQQTALDLLEQGLNVHVVVDATSSRSMVDRKYGLEVRA